MNQYSGTPVSAIAPTLSGFMPLQARIEQLEAGLREALDRTDGTTYYPHHDVPEPPIDKENDPSILSRVDVLNGMVTELNQRLARIQEVTGGRI